MSSVSVREFSFNPSGMFARVEQGETIEVTRHCKVIAVLLPGSGVLGRYAELVARGTIRLKTTTTSDLDRLPLYAAPAGENPLDILMAERGASTIGFVETVRTLGRIGARRRVTGPGSR